MCLEFAYDIGHQHVGLDGGFECFASPLETVLFKDRMEVYRPKLRKYLGEKGNGHRTALDKYVKSLANFAFSGRTFLNTPGSSLKATF